MFCLQIRNTLLKLALGFWWLSWPLQSFQKQCYFVSRVECGFLNWFRVDLCWNMSFLFWIVWWHKLVMCFKKEYVGTAESIESVKFLLVLEGILSSLYLYFPSITSLYFKESNIYLLLGPGFVWNTFACVRSYSGSLSRLYCHC